MRNPNKKLLFILLFSAFFLIAVFLFSLSSVEMRLSDISLSPTAFHNLMDERTQTDHFSDPILMINGYKLAYDQASKTFFYSVVQDDAFKYDPLVSVRGLSAGNRFAFQKAEFSDEAMRNNTKYPFIIYSEKQYMQYYLTLTNLPVVRIEANNAIENEDIRYSERISVSFTLFDNRSNLSSQQRLSKSDASMHIRGGTSRTYPKKSFRVSLSHRSPGGNNRNNHLSLLGMRTDDDWILYAAYDDPHKVRNVFSSTLWTDMSAGNNQFGIINGTWGEYIELFINDRYWGVYALMYPVDIKQLELIETSDVLTNDYHYRAYNNQPDMTYDMFFSASEGSLYGKYELYFPKTSISDWRRWKPLSDFLYVLSLDKDEFLEHYPESVDINNVIDLQIFLMASLAIDNDAKNIDIVAKFNGRKHVMLFSPWDLDITWGRGFSTSVVLSPSHQFLPVSFGMSQALDLRIPGFAEQLQSRYKTLRSSWLSNQSLLSRLDLYEKSIFGSGAIVRDKERWPQAASAESMDDLAAYIVKRMEYMDDFIASLGQGGKE